MADLVARPAWAGLDLPFFAGGVTLAVLPDAAMASVAPVRGGAEALADLLGAALPVPGRIANLDDGSELIWAGLDLWLLRGPAAAPDLAVRLAGRAAVTDQSDVWTGLALHGEAAADMLARLVPVDLAPAAFPPGSVARSGLRHVPCLLVSRETGFDVFLMRSFATTAVDEIASAMRSVAARRLLAAATHG